MLPLINNEGSEFCTKCHFGVSRGIKYFDTISNMYVFVSFFMVMFMFIVTFINI